MAKKQAKEATKKTVVSGPCGDCNATGLLNGVVDATSVCPTCGGSGQLGDNMEEVKEETTEEVTPEVTEEPKVEEEATEE